MNIAQYLDSTYLKTPAQSGLSEEETLQKDKDLAQEAIDNGIFAVMIRPDYISEIKSIFLKGIQMLWWEQLSVFMKEHIL